VKADIRDIDVTYVEGVGVTQVTVRAALKDDEEHEFILYADTEGPLRDALTQLESVLQDFMTQRVKSWLGETT